MKKQFYMSLLAEKGIDFHSVKAGLNFKKRQSHKTLCGVMVSLCSIALFTLVCYYYGKQLFERKNPFVVTNERFVRNPERMTIDKAQQTMMVALRNRSGIPIKDPSLYQVTARLFILQNKMNETTHFNQTYLSEKLLKMRYCTVDDIKVDGLKEFFSKIGLDKYHCFDDNQEVYLEGDVSGDYYTQIEIFIKQCRNSTTPGSVVCSPQSVIDEKLSYTHFMAYTIDKLVDPTNLENPFSYQGINLYAQCSNKQSKEIIYSYQNYYIHTDTGIINEDIEIQRDFVLGSQSESISFEDPNNIAKVILKPVKNREIIISRRYMKISDLVAQVGGLFQVITIVGAFLVIPFAKFHLNTEIVKSIFDFDFQDENDNKNNYQQKNQQAQSNQQTIQDKQLIIIPRSSERQKLNNQQDQFDQSQKQLTQSVEFSNNQNKQNNNPNNENQLRVLSLKFQKYQKNSNSQNDQGLINSQSIQINLAQQPSNLHSHRQQSNQRNSINKTSQEDQLLFSRKLTQRQTLINQSEYLKSQEQFQDNETKKIVMEKSISHWVSEKINRLREVDLYSTLDYLQYLIFPFSGKMKKIKPLIDMSIQKAQSHLDIEYILNKFQEVDKLKQILLTDDQMKLFELIPRPIVKKNPQTNKISIDSKYYYEEKSFEEKQKDACNSLLKILSKDKRSQRDLKLIELLDETFLNFIQLEENERNIQQKQSIQDSQQIQRKYSDDEVKENNNEIRSISQKNEDTQCNTCINSSEKLSPYYTNRLQSIRTQENYTNYNDEDDEKSTRRLKYQFNIHRNSLNC